MRESKRLFDVTCIQILSLCDMGQDGDFFELLEPELIYKISSSSGQIWKSVYSLLVLDRSEYQFLFEDTELLFGLQRCVISWARMRALAMTSLRNSPTSMLIPLFIIECGLVILLYNIYFYDRESWVWEEAMELAGPSLFFVHVSKLGDVFPRDLRRVVSDSKKKMICRYKKTADDIFRDVYFNVAFNVCIDYDGQMDKKINLSLINELSVINCNITLSIFMRDYLKLKETPLQDEWKLFEETLEKWLCQVSKREQTDAYHRFCRGLICTTHLNCCDHDELNVADAAEVLSLQDPEKINEIQTILSENSRNFLTNENMENEDRNACAVALFDYYLRQFTNHQFVGSFFMSGYSYKRLFIFIDNYRRERMKNPPPIIFDFDGSAYVMWKDESGSVCTSRVTSFIEGISYWLGHVVSVRKKKLNISVSIQNLLEFISSIDSLTGDSSSLSFSKNPIRSVESRKFL